MPTISIITVVLDGTHQHITETYDSLRAQKLPEGWAWQWVVQEDGETGRPLAALPDDPHVAPGMGPRGRAAVARTLALNRADGVLARALDADDVLTGGALARDIETLTEHPELGWCVSPVLNVSPDGQQSESRQDSEMGSEPLPHDYFLDASKRTDLLHLPGTTLCTYTHLVRTLGGWPALPANDDVALLLAVEAVSDGWMLSESALGR
ncbi:MAG: glycosyltransferase family 2 protein [Streptosporangiaceae bacterium]